MLVEPRNEIISNRSLDIARSIFEAALIVDKNVRKAVDDTNDALRAQQESYLRSCDVPDRQVLPHLGVGAIILPTGGELLEGLGWFLDQPPTRDEDWCEDYFDFGGAIIADQTSGRYEEGHFRRALPRLLDWQVEILLAAEEQIQPLREMISASFQYHHTIWVLAN